MEFCIVATFRNVMEIVQKMCKFRGWKGRQDQDVYSENVKPRFEAAFVDIRCRDEPPRALVKQRPSEREGSRAPARSEEQGLNSRPHSEPE